jgi:hypothetical protein
MKTKHPSYCCQKCGELIGWIGRVLPFHKCKEKNMNSLPRYNEKGELDTRLTVDPLTGDVGIGTPKLEKKDEPVGWIDSKGNMICVKTDESCRPLYTTPQRTWVGLTDEDIQKLAVEQHDWESLYLAVQAKLKEKNT